MFNEVLILWFATACCALLSGMVFVLAKRNGKLIETIDNMKDIFRSRDGLHHEVLERATVRIRELEEEVRALQKVLRETEADLVAIAEGKTI